MVCLSEELRTYSILVLIDLIFHLFADCYLIEAHIFGNITSCIRAFSILLTLLEAFSFIHDVLDLQKVLHVLYLICLVVVLKYLVRGYLQKERLFWSIVSKAQSVVAGKRGRRSFGYLVPLDPQPASRD